MWPLRFGGFGKVSLVLPVVSHCLCLCTREECWTLVSLWFYCYTRQWALYRRFWVNRTLVVVRDTNTTRSWWQSHVDSRPSIIMICLILIASRIYTFWVLLKTLVDLCSLPNDAHETRKWSCGTALQQCTIRIVNQVLFLRYWIYCRYFIYLMHPFPYVSSLLPLAPMYPWELLSAWVN
jgi:hypothetical protein